MSKTAYQIHSSGLSPELVRDYGYRCFTESEIAEIQAEAEKAGYERGVNASAKIVDNSGIDDCRATAIKMRDRIKALLNPEKK